jgi:probable HAF family extracellular repeat protein
MPIATFRGRAALSATPLAALVLASPVVAQSFMGLGVPAGSSPAAYGYALSAGGAFAVGAQNSNSNNRAFFYTAASGRAVLPIPAGFVNSYASGVSSNGAVIVGTVQHAGGDGIAARWISPSSPPQLVGTLAGGLYSSAAAVSRSGLVVVGASDFNASFGPQHAYRWISGVSMRDLGVLPNYADSGAQGVSDDGSVVVGTCDDLANDYRAWRWTTAGMVDLGGLPGAGNQNFANAVSADGSIVIGQSLNQAFRWTAGTGMQPLPLLAGANSAIASAITGDGSIIVGAAGFPAGEAPVYWDAAGAHDFIELFGSVPPPGWVPQHIVAVSDNGLVFLGQGLHNGVSEAWILRRTPAVRPKRAAN